MSSPNFRVDELLIPGQHIRQYPRATANGEEDVLEIAIKRYTPLDNPHPQPGDITFIAAHANGVVKELYEPLWDELYQQSKATGQFRIRSIWMADVAWQGASSVINEDKLGVDPSWFDHPRDLLHMINHFRKEMVRPLFGIGHSMGGNHVINLALMHPRLLRALLLVDPVAQRVPSLQGNYLPAFSSTFRRDVWPSREEAAAGFRRNPFYQGWDPRCLDLYIKYGLRDLPTALHPTYVPRPGKSATNEAPPNHPVTLTSTKHQEVFTFMRPNLPSEMSKEAVANHVSNRQTHPDIVPVPMPSAPFYRPEPIITSMNLPQLRPRVLFIFASDSPLSAPHFREYKMAITGSGYSGSGGQGYEKAVQEVVIEKAGHFVPFEQPAAVAEVAAAWLGEETARWMREEAQEKREWEEIKAKDGGKGRISLSEEYTEWMKFDKELKVKADEEHRDKEKRVTGGSKL